MFRWMTADDSRIQFDGSELDFWLGQWAVSWDGGAGTNRLERILGGHVIHEQFEGVSSGDSGALHGQSWSVFEPARELWRQTWVDDQGGYFDLIGGRVDGWFAFVRDAPERGGQARQRMVFRDIEPDRCRWTWELSLDGGTTWEVRWEIAYRRARVVESFEQ
jgi:hypothetical protein